jgi:hypothetical protein
LWRIGIGTSPAEAAQDFSSVYFFVAEELAKIAEKLADHRRLEDSGADIVYPIERPLASGRIEQPQRGSFDGTSLAQGRVFIDIAESFQNRLHLQGSVEVDPFVRVLQASFEEAVVHLPRTEQEVEIVHRTWNRRRLGETLHGAQQQNCYYWSKHTVSIYRRVVFS